MVVAQHALAAGFIEGRCLRFIREWLINVSRFVGLVCVPHVDGHLHHAATLPKMRFIVRLSRPPRFLASIAVVTTHPARLVLERHLNDINVGFGMVLQDEGSAP